MNFSDLIDQHKLLICVGSGGVGKTTTAAAIGLRAARQGHKVLVLTIDPARRLANSLGLAQFGNEEARIRIEDAPGELWAMMLDSQSTFDSLIRKVSPDEQTRDRIFANRVYRHIADSFGGSQEYMATERLYDVVESGRYDLVVLDTPPVKNALDFLESPGRLTRFLDRRVLQWFLAPYEDGRVFGRIFRGTSAVVFRLLGYIFGREFLDEIGEFLYVFRDLADGFRERHEAVIRLFSDQSTTFLVVCAPTSPSIAVARYFLEELDSRKMPCAGVVVNQVHTCGGEIFDPGQTIGPLLDTPSEGLGAHTGSQLMARLGAAHRRLVGLAAAEASLVESIQGCLAAGAQLWKVPRFEGEVHDLDALDKVGGALEG
jgi:anion-transporting  ArsA/GET3 family ATPase